ncbi:MAG: hypothetical protein QNJ34_14975 [Xenococcaceae cyanobacterium MO_188.B29]|nr:hypothetical protein [Xenococcaceae cyanobacterium MO_188.B29]
MATDYILFIHGVSTRERRESPEYAKDLIEGIQSKSIEFVDIPLYWGDVNEAAETKLLERLQASPLWARMWFRSLREKQLLQFAGDAALYISRHVGYKVVKRLKTDALKVLQHAEPNDCLHLVTHSWGTVILFDILFATRWDDPNVPGHEEVLQIRDVIFGLSGKDDSIHQGIRLASINTMGSPIAIFSLTSITDDPNQSTPDSSSHNITLCLQKLLNNLYQARNGEKLPWRNFVHLGDPIAFPLEQLMKDMIDKDEKYIDFQDLIIQEPKFLDFLTQPLRQTIFALLRWGQAHDSYWQSQTVIREISSILKNKVTA